jgi:hypothetical protein
LELAAEDVLLAEREGPPAPVLSTINEGSINGTYEFLSVSAADRRVSEGEAAKVTMGAADLDGKALLMV